MCVNRRSSFVRRPRRILVVLVLLLATALRFYGLGSKSLWGDEIAQAVWSAWDWAPLWQEFRAPPDFISHFVLVHLAQLLGRDEFWTRLPSAISSTLAVPLTYVLAKRLTDRVTALVAMTLMAVAPYQIWYAQEGRMYAALGCYAVLSLYFFVRVVGVGENRPETGNWGRETGDWTIAFGLLVGNTLAIYTHLFGVFPIVGEGVAAVGLLGASWIRERRLTVPRWAVPVGISFGLTALLALPLVPGTVPYVVQGAKPAVAESIAPAVSFQLSSGFVWELLGDIGMGARESWRTMLSLALAVIGLIVLGVRRPPAGWIAGVWLMLPLLVLAMTQPRHGVSARYLIFLQPVYLIVIAYAVVLGASVLTARFGRFFGKESARRFSVSTAALTVPGILLLGIIVIPPLAELYPRAKLNDWRAIARYIQANGRAGELVFGERNTPNMNALTYYLPNLLRYNTPPTTLDALVNAQKENRSLWYISVGEFFDPEGEAWVRENLKVVPLSDWLDPALRYAPESVFEYPQSEHLATLYFRSGELPAEITYVGRQGFSNENIDRLKMNPGETLEAELQLNSNGARQLEIELASKKAAQFDVMVNGKLLAHVRESEADKGMEKVSWELRDGGERIHVQVINLSADFPLFIKRIALRRVP